MQHQEIIVDRPLNIVRNKVERAIVRISGEVDDKEENTFFWKYYIGIHEVHCETILEAAKDSTQVTTFAFSKSRKGSLTFLLSKFHSALWEMNESTEEKPEPSAKRTTERTKKPSKNEQNYLQYLLLGLVVFTVGFAIFDNMGTGSSNSLSTNITTDDNYYTNEGFYGAYTKEDFNLLMSGDQQVFERLKRNGRVIFIPSNAKAYLIEAEWPGAVKIRLEGRATEFWTVQDAIDR